jgi:hypothetical protein
LNKPNAAKPFLACCYKYRPCHAWWDNSSRRNTT